jgi:thioredoxin reductase (NADPH)
VVSNLVSNALENHAQVFPVLTEAQINRIRPFASLRHMNDGDVRFRADDSDAPFFILLSGSMEIVQPNMNGERLVANHGLAEFTGEMTMIAGHRSLVCGRMTSVGDVLEMSGSGLRSLVARDGELSEVFMRAFSQGNVILMGSRDSAKNLHLREFLTRNGHPYVYVDLDVDQEAQALLNRFAVSVSEIPVVICNYRAVLRNLSIQELSDSLELNCTINESQVRDVIIVGAGPAGLEAAVYGASEGLDVLMARSQER